MRGVPLEVRRQPVTSSALRAGGSTAAWRRLRLRILERDGWRCRVPVDPAGNAAATGPECGARLVPSTSTRDRDRHAHVDHVVPRAECARLGVEPDDPVNLRAACGRHNLQRSGYQVAAARVLSTSREW